MYKLLREDAYLLYVSNRVTEFENISSKLILTYYNQMMEPSVRYHSTSLEGYHDKGLIFTAFRITYLRLIQQAYISYLLYEIQLDTNFNCTTWIKTLFIKHSN